MAILRSGANGDFNAAGTWNVIDSGTYTDALVPVATVTVTTTPTNYGNFTPGGITINAYGVKLYYGAVTPSGTATFVIRNVTDNVDVANTTVTVNMTDMYDGRVASDLQFSSWFFLKTNGNITFTAGKQYAIRVNTSVTANLFLLGSTTTVLYKALSTTTTGAPANGDTLFICGELTGQGTQNAYTVTMKETSTTNYYGTRGSYGVYVSGYGTLAYDYQASTNYYLKVRGEMGIGSRGTFTMGTLANPIPTTSTATLHFDTAAEQDSGLWLDDYGTINVVGSSLFANGYRSRLDNDVGGLCNTVGTAVTRVTGQAYTGLSGTVSIAGTNYTIATVNSADSITLTGSAGSGTNRIFLPGTSTSITTSTSTGWKSGQTIYIMRTSNVSTDYGENFTLNGDASGTSITLNTNFTKYHDTATDSDWKAEIFNYTRNCVVRGTSTSAPGYVLGRGVNDKEFHHMEVYYLGNVDGSAPSIHGIAAYGWAIHNNATLGTNNVSYCCFHDFGATGGTNGANYIIDQEAANGNSSWLNVDVKSVQFYIGASTSGVANTVDGLWIGGINATYYTYNMADHWINCRMAGSNFALGSTSNGETGGYFKDSFVHGHGTGITIGFGGVRDFLIDNIKTKRNYGYGWILNTTFNNLVMSNCSDVGSVNGFMNIAENAIKNTQILNCTSNGETGYGCLYGVVLSGTLIDNSYFGNCDFGYTVAHTTAEVYVADYENAEGLFIDCRFGGVPILLVAASEPSRTGINIRYLDYNQTSGDHRQYVPWGRFQSDTTIYRTASPSMRMIPINANKRMESSHFTMPAKSGETVTPSVYVRESVVGDGTDYNGNRARLIVKANYLGGITSDTVLATATNASEGNWEMLSGTTAAVTADCILEFVVQVDGTTGWVNVDDVNFNRTNNSRQLKYWWLGEPYVVGSNVGAGGSTTFIG